MLKHRGSNQTFHLTGFNMSWTQKLVDHMVTLVVLRITSHRHLKNRESKPSRFTYQLSWGKIFSKSETVFQRLISMPKTNKQRKKLRLEETQRSIKENLQLMRVNHLMKRLTNNQWLKEKLKIRNTRSLLWVRCFKIFLEIISQISRFI